jgi:hypothetical protein
MILPKDFHEFLSLLQKHDIEYVIVGGYALSFHGYIRNTGDLDILINPTDSNKRSMVKVFHEFGFSKETALGLFPAGGNALGIGTPPLRLEILTEISGLSNVEALSDKNTMSCQGTLIYIINYHALIKNKRSSGRLKDLADVEELQKIKRIENNE